MGATSLANEFWLSDVQWAVIEPLIPMGRPGVKPRRNRKVIRGILHILKFGCRWRDCPDVYGPDTTIYNRFNRWSKAGIWQVICAGLVSLDNADLQCIDSTTVKAHRCSAGRKGGRKIRPSAVAGAGEPPRFTLLLTGSDG